MNLEAHAHAPYFRDQSGQIVEALNYNVENGEALLGWIASTGARGTAITAYDALTVAAPNVLVLHFDAGLVIELREGDWLVRCGCPDGFHRASPEQFNAFYTRVPEPGQEDLPEDGEQPAPVFSDRYQRTNAQVVADLQDWARQGVGHYGNEKPGNVLLAAYMDALELALYLREQIEIASTMQGN